ncbi:hypothetical protein U9M48_028572 [Paspalum notatum var. saurae]|uniref:Uncharacterized protein n=1 Tax=Paspalum notatum var. saurae TaxID=547442 RepID=A0AAQ3X1S3_PASNO
MIAQCLPLEFEQQSKQNMKTSTKGLFHDNSRIKLGGGYTKRYHTSSNPTPERKDFDIQPTIVVDRYETLTMLCITWEANIKAISHLESTSGTPQDLLMSL